jgi:hypothetical protein
VHSLQNVDVLRQLATEREAQLRRTSLQVGRDHSRPVRRWVGRQLVRFGAWVAAEPTMRPARAR